MLFISFIFGKHNFFLYLYEIKNGKINNTYSYYIKIGKSCIMYNVGIYIKITRNLFFRISIPGKLKTTENM